MSDFRLALHEFLNYQYRKQYLTLIQQHIVTKQQLEQQINQQLSQLEQDYNHQYEILANLIDRNEHTPAYAPPPYAPPPYFPQAPQHHNTLPRLLPSPTFSNSSSGSPPASFLIINYPPMPPPDQHQ